ncbi:hypothetical protein MRX96_032204 [Rhipicephalus microplus]
MDILPSGNIFHELQAIHDTGFFPAQPSLEDFWQQAHGVEFSAAVSPPALETGSLPALVPCSAMLRKACARATGRFQTGRRR